MFSYNDLTSLHLEITNRCQASCPMCSRNYHGGQDNLNLKETDWLFKDFTSIVNPILSQLSSITFCGNFGDPVVNNDLQLMTNMLKSTNIAVDIHTNGSLRNKKYWQVFPKYLPKNHRIVFAIDGLNDTHKLYRIGTDFNKVLDNAKAFIQAGGIAEWCFIKFKHNEHQVEAARALAKTHGFKYFSEKDSSRFNFEKRFPVLNKNNEVEYYLEPPTINRVKYFDVQNLDNVKPLIDNSEINCYAKHKGEIYIDAHKNIMPCCFLAAIPYDYYRKGDILQNAKDVIKIQYKNLISELGNTSATQGIQAVVESSSFQSVWKKYWTINKLWTCARTCGTTFDKPNDQIQSYHEL